MLENKLFSRLIWQKIIIIKGNDMKNKDNIPQFVNSDSFMADKNYVK